MCERRGPFLSEGHGDRFFKVVGNKRTILVLLLLLLVLLLLLELSPEKEDLRGGC